MACLNGQLSFWTVKQCVQAGSIEGRHDLGYTRKDTDKITAKTSSMSKYVTLSCGIFQLNTECIFRAFTTLCYSADGQCILAAGQSKNVCIYSVADQILMKKFEISQNLSLDGTQVGFLPRAIYFY